ncbi:hypothetical protein LY78DRAFT_235256 [Colletotrichum sublineola]|nr:hypothetical protein LY78DRAFT_235256 [Colletotrichum sublineola]
MSFTAYYDYRPLVDPEDCIRLLKLLPAGTEHAQDIWGELITCRRDDAPPYQPVSYTWGQQDASSVMFLRDSEDTECDCFKCKTAS